MDSVVAAFVVVFIFGFSLYLGLTSESFRIAATCALSRNENMSAQRVAAGLDLPGDCVRRSGALSDLDEAFRSALDACGLLGIAFIFIQTAMTL